MNAKENKQRIREWVSALNREVLDGMEMLFHDQFVDHNPFPGQTPDKAGYIKLLHTAHGEWFPGYQVTIQDLLADGDKVSVRATVDAVHENSVFGSAPSGNRIHWEAMAIYRFTDGQIIERWELFDSMGLMVQLGVVALPESLAGGKP